MDIFSKYEHLQIEEICRVCLSKREQMNLISETGLTEMLLECASVQLSEEDGLYLVCKHCSNEISRWYVFKQQIVKSFEIGRWLIKQRLKRTTELRSIDANNELNAALLNIPRETLTTEMFDLVNVRENMTYGYLTSDDTSSNNLNSTINGNTSSVAFEECNKEFSSLTSSENHKKSYQNKQFECSKCNKVFKQSQSLNDHMKRHYNYRSHACDVCGKKFYKQFNLTEHKRIHTGERPFKCQSCRKNFTRALLLRNHIKKVHTGDKKFICGVCSKDFVDNYQLKIHTRIHTGEKPFPCDKCEKAFAMLGQLKSHIKYKHTLQKDFICNVCGRAFTAKHTLEEHLRTHSGEKREPRHMCSSCGKKCITTTQLKIHIRSIHTGERPYQCEFCEKRFITRPILNSHLNTHTGERPFICSECNKNFSTKSSLRTHQRIHLGIKPYKCQSCSKSFIQASTLKAHLKTHESTINNLTNISCN